MELKDWLSIVSLGVALLSGAATVVLFIRRSGAQAALTDHKLGAAVPREELHKYATKEHLTAEISAALAQAALKYQEKSHTHDVIDKAAKELYDRINRLNETLQTALTAAQAATRDKTEQLNVQVQVLKEGVASVSDGLEALEKIVTELLTKNADHGARITAQEQMRVAFEQLRVQVAKIEGLLTKGGKNV